MINGMRPFFAGLLSSFSYRPSRPSSDEKPTGALVTSQRCIDNAIPETPQEQVTKPEAPEAIAHFQL